MLSDLFYSLSVIHITGIIYSLYVLIRILNDRYKDHLLFLKHTKNNMIFQLILYSWIFIGLFTEQNIWFGIYFLLVILKFFIFKELTSITLFISKVFKVERENFYFYFFIIFQLINLYMITIGSYYYFFSQHNLNEIIFSYF